MKHRLLGRLQIDDFCTELSVETNGENTALTFENGRGTMQASFLLDRDSLQWLREQLQDAANRISKQAESEKTKQ